MKQLMGIMHDSVGAIIPRLSGTPTTKLSLKTFSDNLLYRGDFNFNWKRIDSLTTVFNSSDFKMSGDTLKLKNGTAGIDTTKIGYLAKNQTWTFANIFTQTTAFNNGLWIAKTGGGASALFIPATFTNAHTWYIPDETDTLAGKTWVRSHAASGGIDSTKIPYLAKNNTFTGNNVFGGSSKVVQFLNPPYFGALGSLNGLFYLMSSGSYYTQINATTPTANRTITFPNATGTVALTNQVPTLAGSNEFTGSNTFQDAIALHGGLALPTSDVSPTNGGLSYTTTGGYGTLPLYFVGVDGRWDTLTTRTWVRSNSKILTSILPVYTITSYTINVTGIQFVKYYGGTQTLYAMTGGADGQVVVITNHAAGTLTIGESPGMTNDFGNGGAGTMSIPQYGAMSFIYNANAGMWFHIK